VTDYYADSIGGDDGNGGESWDDAFETAGTLFTALSADDTGHMRGTFRETPEANTDGSAGHYRFVQGHIWNGQMARITGSDDDVSTTRNDGLYGYGSYWRFRGLRIDGCAVHGVNVDGGDYWDIEDCVITHCDGMGILFNEVVGSNIRRSRIVFNKQFGIYLYSGGASDTANAIENCDIVGGDNTGILDEGVGGVTVNNAFISGFVTGCNVVSLPGGQTVTVKNSVLTAMLYGMWADVDGQITEDYNDLFALGTPRTNISSVGAHSRTSIPFLQSSLLDGEHILSAIPRIPAPYSSLAALAGSGVPNDDLYGQARETPSSWGPVQYVVGRRPDDAGEPRGRRGS
jgi:hypothetical protein